MTKKTLVCVHPQTRAHEVVWDNFKKNVLDELDADLALSIATPDDYDYSNPYWQHAKYRWTQPEYQNWFDAYEFARQTDFPNASPEHWKKLLSLSGNAFTPLNVPGWRDSGRCLIITFFRWFLWHNIKKENIFDQYDRIIVTRSDFNWLCPHPPLELLDPNYIWIPNLEHHSGICDRHAILSKTNTEGYLSIMKNMLLNTDEIYNRFVATHDHAHFERLLKFVVDIEVGIESVRQFPYVMYAVRHFQPQDPRNHNLGHHPKFSFEVQSAFNLKDVYKTKEDWLTKGF
jgi:hypothetical protein